MESPRLYLLLILFFTVSAADSFCQGKKEKLYRFYDFNISIESRKGLVPIVSDREKLKKKDKKELSDLYQNSEWKYIIQNAGGYHDRETGNETELEEQVLYFIQYLHYKDSDGSPVVKEPADTLRIKLSKGQLDSIYTLMKKVFTLDDEPNLSPNQIPPPPPTDGEWALVTFDMGFRGNRFEAAIKQPKYYAHNKDYLSLFNYLENIKKQFITTPTR